MDGKGKPDIDKVLESREDIPPNTKISKVHGGSLVWVIDETTGHALSVAFVPEAVDYSLFSSTEPAELPEGDLHALSGSPHVYVHNPQSSYPNNNPIPLAVWVVNK